MGGLIRVAVLLAVVLGGVAPSFGQVSFSLPLQGYYRAGRYMPVECKTPADGFVATSMVLQADEPHAAPTEIAAGFFQASLAARRLAPVLLLSDQATRLNDLPLHSLAANQRLVGIFDPAADVDIGRQVFPEQVIVPVRLDADLLDGDDWQSFDSLDAMVLADYPSDPIKRELLAELRADGTTLVVTGPKMTAADAYPWPWKRQGTLWICRPANPAPPLICPAAYEPVLGWNPGRPARFRWQVVILGVVTVLLLGLASMVNQRWCVAVVMAVAVGLACGVGIWNRGQPITVETVGVVRLVESPPAYTRDHWHYYSSVADDDIFTADACTHPVFYDETQLAAARPRVLVRPPGHAGLLLHGSAGFALALMATDPEPGRLALDDCRPGPAPIAKLAVPAIYPGWTIDLQQVAGGNQVLGQVRLRRSLP